MGWLSPLVRFLPLLVFATYAYWNGPPARERWLEAFLIGGGAALVQLAVELRRRELLHRLALGVNVYLILGAAAVLTRQWWLLQAYGALGESAIFAGMALVGVATTLASPAGFIGVRGDRPRVRLYSVYLLALAAGAVALSFALRGRTALSVGIPLTVLTLAQRQLAERLAGGTATVPVATAAGEKLLAELKARCGDLDRLRARLAERARHEATVRQTDTYFQAPQGRLKLREVEGRPAQLIYYERPDVSDVKTSEVSIVRLPDPADARRLLERMLGARAVVAKVREIWRLEGVQVHLDRVDGLGTFVELEEVVASAADLPAGDAHVRRLMADLGIEPGALEARSYVDLVSGSAPAPGPSARA